MNQVIPVEILKKTDKMLFIVHLALGDFTYLQNYFMFFSKTYPHIKIDLWVDEVRRTDDESKWPQLKNYVLYDWVASCKFFNKIYNETYSPDLFRKSIKAGQKENYPLVVSLATLRPHKYAYLAREISPNGFVVGMRKRKSIFDFIGRKFYKNLDAYLNIYSATGVVQRHISEIHAGWFNDLFGMNILPSQRFPFIDIPEKWIDYAKQKFENWRIPSCGGKVIFINPYAKTEKRCWPVENIALLVREIRALAGWKDAYFVVNAMPYNMPEVEKICTNYQLERTFIFSAEENFFQLPAVIQQCDLVISVETAVMHLANALHIPVIALMRQKNPEWVPIDKENSIVITAKKRRDWVKSISVEEVVKVLQ